MIKYDNLWKVTQVVGQVLLLWQNINITPESLYVVGEIARLADSF